jgi:hypothetical protein
MREQKVCAYDSNAGTANRVMVLPAIGSVVSAEAAAGSGVTMLLPVFCLCRGLLNPRTYRYSHPCDDLPDGTNHRVAIVLVGFDVDEQGATIPKNFVVTAFFKHIR